MRLPRRLPGRRRRAIGRDILAFILILLVSDLLWLISNQAVQAMIGWSNTLPGGSYDPSTFNLLNVAWTWWPVLNLFSLAFWLLAKAIMRRLIPAGMV